MRPPLEVDGAPPAPVVAALERTGLIASPAPGPAPRWDSGYPCAVVAAWAARQVRLGRADAPWLVQLLGSVDPTLRAETERLDAFLAAVERSLDRSAGDSPSAAAARRDVERLVWFLTPQDPDDDVGPFPGLRRQVDHIETATRDVRADLRRVSAVPWELHVSTDGILVLGDGTRSATSDIGAYVDPDRLLADEDPAEVEHALADESGEAVADKVVALLHARRTPLRCPHHGSSLVLSWCEWVCEKTAHTVGSRGELPPSGATI